MIRMEWRVGFHGLIVHVWPDDDGFNGLVNMLDV